MVTGKSPTFYYHVKQLRKKACDIPENTYSGKNDIQEVVPLLMEEPADINPKPLQKPPTEDAISVHLDIHGNEFLINIRNIFLAFFDHLWIEGSFTVLWNLNIHVVITAVDTLGCIAVMVLIAVRAL